MTSVSWSFHGGSWLPNTGHQTCKKIVWTCMMYLFSDWIGANRMAGRESTKLRNITQCYQSTVWLLERSNIHFEQSTAANRLIIFKAYYVFSFSVCILSTFLDTKTQMGPHVRLKACCSMTTYTKFGPWFCCLLLALSAAFAELLKLCELAEELLSAKLMNFASLIVSPTSAGVQMLLQLCIQTDRRPCESCPHSVTFGGHWCKLTSVHGNSAPWSFSAEADRPGCEPCLCHALPCCVSMPTRLGRGPGRQSALEAVSGDSAWQHANVCKWRGPGMTPAHRRNGPCPSLQRTWDGGYVGKHTITKSNTQKHKLLTMNSCKVENPSW